LLSIGVVFASGCGSGKTVGPGASGPGGPATTLSLDRDLQPLFTAQCAFVGCHAGAAPQAGQDLSAGNAYESLVNVESTQVAGVQRVLPGDPDASFLLEKVSSDQPRVGSRMPLAGSPLSEDEIDMIREWIRQGALP
jgi:hypothetical protein